MSEERLYGMLPRIVRRLDLESEQVLRAFLATLDRDDDAVRARWWALWRGWFVETCELDDLHRIAPLVGMEGIVRDDWVLPSHRALVANAIRNSRRKGTVAALQAVLAQATGWPARVTEMWPEVGRGGSDPTAPATLDVRVGGDPWIHVLRGVAHTVDVRASGIERTVHPLSLRVELCLFDVTRVEDAPALAVAPGVYTVHPLGWEQPLLSDPDGFPTYAAPQDVEIRIDRQPWDRRDVVPACRNSRPGPQWRAFQGAVVVTDEAQLGGGLRLRVGSLETIAWVEDGLGDIDAVASRVEVAIRQSSSNSAFRDCLVFAVDGSLLFLPGVCEPGLVVLISDIEGDTWLASRLGLLTLCVRPALRGWSKSITGPRQVLEFISPRSGLVIEPASTDELVDGISREPEWAAFWRDGLVIVAPGAAGSLFVKGSQDDLRGLGLHAKVAVDVERGRVLLPIGTTAESISVGCFTASMSLGANCPAIPDDGEWEHQSWVQETPLAQISLSDGTHVHLLEGSHTHELQLDLGPRRVRIEAEVATISHIGRLMVRLDGGALTLVGLTIGELVVLGAGQLTLVNCSVADAVELRGPTELSARRCFLGPLRAGPQAVLQLKTCVVNAHSGVAVCGLQSESCREGPTGYLDGCTLLGDVVLSEGSVFDTVVAGLLRVLVFAPEAIGHSTAAVGSDAADLLLLHREIRFLSLEPGDPMYAVLEDPDEKLATLARSGGRPGAHHARRWERRQAAMLSVLRDWVPSGLHTAVLMVHEVEYAR